MNTIYTSRRGRRGSVLILVVAVLALLVLMGTAYIVSARTDRANATAMSASNNVDLARDAVMSQVQQVIGSAMLDSAGKVGGYDATTGTYMRTIGGGGTAALAARNYDYPELGTTYGETTANPNMQDEPWLVAHLHNQGGAQNDMSLLTSGPYDPATGTFPAGQNYSTPPANAYVFGLVNGPQSVTDALMTVVADQTSTATDNIADDKPTGRADAYINLLPFSDASGVRYRYGARILDTSRMANLNTGNPNDSLTDATGTNLSSYRLAPSNAGTTNYFNFATDTSPENLQDSRGGTPVIHFNQYTDWEPIVLRLEKPPISTLALFDLSDELELRSYGEFGTLYTARPAASTVWPGTLGNLQSGNVRGNPRRRNFTTYSFSREVRPYADPTTKYTLTPAAGGTVTPTLPSGATPTTIWPQTYARIPVNQPIDTSPAGAAASIGTIATEATNIATAMNNASSTINPTMPAFVDGTMKGFGVSTDIPPLNPDEMASYVANFIEGRWSGLTADSTGAYSLVGGPTIITEGGGLEVCTADNTGAKCSGNFTGSVAASSGHIVVGYAAQPFINEIAEGLTSSDQKTIDPPQNFGIELYNPYGITLSMKDFSIKIDGGAMVSLAAAPSIPPGKYLVIAVAKGLSTAPGVLELDGVISLPSQNHVVLYRNCSATGEPLQVAVDQGSWNNEFAVPAINAASLNSTPTTYSIERSAANWGCAVNKFSPIAATPGTMGTVNANNVGTGIVLYDRYANTPADTTAAPSTASPTPQGTPFANIADFNTVMRLANIDLASGEPFALITDQVKTIMTNAASAPWSGMQLPIEAQVHFDFMGAAQYYSTSPPSDIAVSGNGPPKHGDIRAMRVLDQIAFIDRVSDAKIDIGGGTTDINKIRLPGQVNVNTASGDVLRALPGIQALGANADKAVANILAYRARLGTSTIYNSTAASTDYSTYSGVGIRSLAELMVPINDATGMSAQTNISIPVRDAAWASIYNLCTVRSDTFVVYGYLEAVKQNPNFKSATFDNYSHWYTPSNDPTFYPASSPPIDDPRNTGPLIRVGRRRWVAIVDRSFCNYGAADAKYTIPRVVAIKDLPQ